MKKVEDRIAQIDEAAKDWPMIDALMEGTRSMRAARELLMPRWPKEDVADYEKRLGVATLLPAYRRTISILASKPFSEPLTYGDDVPQQIQELCEDVDLQGRNLHAFAAEAMRQTLAYGFGGILVDYPPADPSVTTLADERRRGARPYMVYVHYKSILGWKVDKTDPTKLAQLRILDQATVDDGEFGESIVPLVRVYEPNLVRVYEKPEGNADFVLKSAHISTLGRIAFIPLYGDRFGFMDGRPPLIELANQNVKHWQSQSDQDNILHYARVPILFMKGNFSITDENGDEQEMSFSASRGITSGDTNSDVKWIEHSGQAINAGKESLDALEDQMKQSGADLLLKREGAPERTATESKADDAGATSDLKRIAERFEDALDAALQIMAEWIGESEGGHVKLYTDFESDSLGDQSAQTILTAKTSGVISHETAIAELKRRGTLSADVDAADEKERIEAEMPPLPDGIEVDENGDPIPQQRQQQQNRPPVN